MAHTQVLIKTIKKESTKIRNFPRRNNIANDDRFFSRTNVNIASPMAVSRLASLTNYPRKTFINLQKWYVATEGGPQGVGGLRTSLGVVGGTGGWLNIIIILALTPRASRADNARRPRRLCSYRTSGVGLRRSLNYGDIDAAVIRYKRAI